MNLVEHYVDKYHNIFMTHTEYPSLKEIYRAHFVAVRVKVNHNLCLYCFIKNRAGNADKVCDGNELNKLIEMVNVNHEEYIIYDVNILNKSQQLYSRAQVIRHLGGNREHGMPMGSNWM